MEFISKKTIKLGRVSTLLDKLVLDFTKTLKKHAKYVIVSGYVSILFGRSRATEDVDVLVEKISKGRFCKLYSDLRKSGYWCVNMEDIDDIMDALYDGCAVRFAKKRKIIPNMEIKFIKNTAERTALRTAIEVLMPAGKIRISNIELQIAFKEKVLKSDKDMDDARHLRVVFKDRIDNKLLDGYRKMLK